MCLNYFRLNIFTIFVYNVAQVFNGESSEIKWNIQLNAEPISQNNVNNCKKHLQILQKTSKDIANSNSFSVLLWK